MPSLLASPAQAMPSCDHAMLLFAFVPEPTATHMEPFHATAAPKFENVFFPSPCQVIPLVDHEMVLVVPSPTATNSAGVKASTPRPILELAVAKMDVSVTPVQVMPSDEYATVYLPVAVGLACPTATHLANRSLYTTPFT